MHELLWAKGIGSKVRLGAFDDAVGVSGADKEPLVAALGAK